MVQERLLLFEALAPKPYSIALAMWLTMQEASSKLVSTVPDGVLAWQRIAKAIELCFEAKASKSSKP